MLSKKRKKGTHGAGSDLLADLHRGGDGVPTGANERFPTAKAIASNASLAFDLDNKAGKVIAGTVGDDLIGIGDDRHCALIGPARSSKSRSHFIPILLTYPANASVVVVDIKGDLASTVARYRALIGQRVWVLDPFKTASSNVEPYRQQGFNPLAGTDPGDADAVVECSILVASALVTRAQGEESHWNDTAEEAIAGACAHVMTSPFHAEQRHLGTVYQLLTQHTKQPEPGVPCDLEAAMRTNPAADGMVMAAAAGLFEKSDRELASTLSTVRRHLGWLKYGKMRRSVESGTGDLSSIQCTPTALFISLPVRHMSSCAGWLRMVMSCLLASFEQGEARRSHQVQSGGHRTLIIIDEMPALGYFRQLEIAAGQIAGLGAKLYFCAQDLNQLQAVFPRSWQTFLANSGMTTFIAPNDPTTLDWIQRRLGDTTIVQHSQSEGSIRALIEDGNSGRSVSRQTHPLMTGAEAARILRREDPFCRQLVISAAHGPMLIQRVNYDQHPGLVKRLQKPEEG